MCRQGGILEKSFQTASLRSIMKAAGVTTGALYVYYDSKEALFDTLVEECYSPFLSAYRTALDVVEDCLDSCCHVCNCIFSIDIFSIILYNQNGLRNPNI